MHQHQDDSRLHHNRLEQMPREIRADLDVRRIAAHVGEQRIDVDNVRLGLANEPTQHRREICTRSHRLAEEQHASLAKTFLPSILAKHGHCRAFEAVVLIGNIVLSLDVRYLQRPDRLNAKPSSSPRPAQTLIECHRAFAASALTDKEH